MPTPRHATEIAKQTQARARGDKSPVSSWVRGVIITAVSDTTPVYQVYTDFGSVEARSIVDAPLRPDSVVWLVRATDGKYLIAGVQ